MQYEVHATDQNREIDPKLNGSFKNSTRFTENFVNTQRDVSQTCGLRGEFTESQNFHFPPLKVTINDLDFRQNPL